MLKMTVEIIELTNRREDKCMEMSELRNVVIEQQARHFEQRLEPIETEVPPLQVLARDILELMVRLRGMYEGAAGSEDREIAEQNTRGVLELPIQEALEATTEEIQSLELLRDMLNTRLEEGLMELQDAQNEEQLNVGYVGDNLDIGHEAPVNEIVGEQENVPRARRYRQLIKWTVLLVTIICLIIVTSLILGGILYLGNNDEDKIDPT